MPQPHEVDRTTRPLIGVLCCNRIVAGRAVQSVANRFVGPVAAIAGASALLVPALPDAIDLARLAGTLDGLLLTGSCSHLSAHRYGDVCDARPDDPDRDEVALRLSAAMIAAGRPVFGICRGLQELNVLFGGTLGAATGHHNGRGDDELEALFAHGHDVTVAGDGVLAGAIGAGRARVNSVHYQGIERLGAGLRIEAIADDGLVEAFSAAPNGGAVLGVQWHPEWHAADDARGRAFFALLGAAARGE